MNNQEGLEIVGSLEQPEANTTIYITDNFTPRQVRMTAGDIRKIPENIDPLLNPAEIAA